MLDKHIISRLDARQRLRRSLVVPHRMKTGWLKNGEVGKRVGRLIFRMDGGRWDRCEFGWATVLEIGQHCSWRMDGDGWVLDVIGWVFVWASVLENGRCHSFGGWMM